MDAFAKDRLDAQSVERLAVAGTITLKDSDLPKLGPHQLERLMVAGVLGDLPQTQRDRLSPTQLERLAVGGNVTLSQVDVQRLQPQQIARLRIAGVL